MTLELTHTDFPDGHPLNDTQMAVAVGGTTSGEAISDTPNQMRAASPDYLPTQSHAHRETHASDALGGHNFPAGHTGPDPQTGRASGDQTTDQGQYVNVAPTAAALVGTDHPDGQSVSDTHYTSAVGDQSSLRGQGECDAQNASALEGTQPPAETAIDAVPPIQRGRSLLDPLLILASVTLDDLEAMRIAQENRYRSLTQSGTSENGLDWGYGLDDRDPQVAAMGAIVDQMKAMEHTANLQLQKLMRKHALGPWVKAQKGIGDKQAARLLGVIGDPYINASIGQPRTVSQLWAYCGLHTLPAHQVIRDTHASSASREYNVAARRRKGEQANWSDDAKKRVWLIATSCLKAGGPYRNVYDDRRTLTAEREHAVECVRCGPSGKPAQPGSPWSAGHQHADALRIVSKRILKDMWRESRRIHTTPGDTK